MAQQNNGNDLEKLYKAVSEKFNIGDYDSFLSKMQTTEDRLRFYNAVREKGYNLGDYNDYESRLGKSLEVPAVGSVDTSVESVEPTSPTEVSPSAPIESSPMQNATSSEQSLTGDQFLNALNKRNRDIAGLTGLEDVLSRQTEVVIPEGTEIIPNAVGPDGLPVYAKLNEDGTYTQGGAILAPIDLAPTLKDIEEQQKPTPWESIKNSISNIGNQLQGFDDRLTIFTTDVYEKVFGKDLGGKIYAFLDDGIITGLPGQDGDKEDLLRRRREEAYEELRRLGEEALPTLGITDSFNSGRIENLAAGIVNAVSAVAGTALVSVPTGGAGLFTEMIGGSLYDYNTAKAEAKGITTKELIDRGEADFWTPFTIGSIGGGLERVGFSGITNSITRKLSGSAAKKAVVLGLDWNKEASTEWVQGGLEAYNKAIAQGGTHEQAIEAMSSHMASEEGLEEYLMGLFGSAGATTIGRLSKGVINKASKDKIRKNANEIQTMVSDMSKTTDPSTRSSLLEVISEKANEILSAKQESNDIESHLTDEQKTEVNELTSIIDSIDDGLANSELSDVSTEALNARKAELEKQVDKIITTREPSTDIAPEAVDKRIQDFRDNNPNVELDDPMDSIPESVDKVMSRIEDNLPVDPVSAKETSDTLYAKYKELSDMKKDPNRTLTIAEIDGYMEQLGADIETLENYTTEGTPVQEQTQENETTETEIQPETTQEVIEVSLESSEVAPVAETTEQTQELVTEPSSSEVEATAKAPVIESPVAETDTTATPNQVKSTPASETTTQAPKTAAQATKTATQAQSSGTQLDPNTVSIPVSDITTDEASFQNRESLDTERVDNIVNNFNEVKFDPIVVYNDDGKMVVLSGHHRFAAAQRMGMKNIPSREFKGTREEAIEFARDSNTLSRPETSVERAYRYRDMRSKGESESTIRDKARAAHGSEATKILNLSRLSENGKSLEAIRSFQDSTDTDTRNKVEAIGDWIGNVKSRHPDISTRQENEMFDYLMDKYGTKKKSGSVTNRSQFFDIANALVDRLKNRGDFNPESVLNLNNAAGKSGIEIEYDETLAEAKENVAKARKALDDARARAVSEGMNPDRMNKVLAPLEENLRNAIADEQAVRAQKGKLQEAVRAQTSIFDIINQNEEQIESNATIEREVQSAFDGEPTENTEASRSDQEVRQESPTGDQSEESSRSVRSGTPQLGESRRDRAGRSDSDQTKKLEGAPNVKGATGPDPALNEVARKYAQSIGIEFNRQTEYVEVDVDRAKRIAKAYEEMEHVPSDPVVKEAYENLIRQTRAQYDALSEAGYVFYFYDETNDPYNGSPWEAMRDLRGNKKMAVFATEAGYGSSATDLDVSDNPLLQDTGIEWGYGSPDGPKKKVTANDLFRAVHDAFGHGLEGAGFRARGEENAWQAHARLFTGSAIGALTTETRGQNSWLNFGPYGEQNRNAKVEDTIFADQKTGLMPEWTWKEGFDGIQYDTPSVSTSEKKDSPSSKTAKPRTPKTLLKGVVDRLSKTGLAKSVSIKNSQEISEDLSRRGSIQFQTDATELSEIESTAKANGTWMKAPNGKATNLNEKQWVLVRTKAFKDWFGDWENNPEGSSKVVDANGEPMVVYHGTNGNFTVFDPSKIGTNANAEGPGFYFTNDKRTAEGYQNANKDNPNLFEVFLNIRNPINLNEPNFKKSEIKRVIKAVINNEIAFDPDGTPNFRDSFMSNFVDTYDMTESRAIDEVANILMEDDTKIDFIAGLGNAVGSQPLVLQSVQEALGYDATISDGYGGMGKGGGSIFVAWDSNQIKSATDNVGTFDGTNPDIRFQTSAWHGSPHVFDKFSTLSIGSGEGAQAFGWGLYFTDLESIAREYANALVGKPNHTGNSTVDWVIDVKKPANKNELLKELERILNEKESVLNNNVLNDNIKDRFKDEIKEIKEGISIVSSKDYNFTFSRNLYSVTLHKGKQPSEYTWLEWDKPVPQDILDKITNGFEKVLGENVSIGEPKTGEELYDAISLVIGANRSSLAKKYGDDIWGSAQKISSLFLLENGIDGIKYPSESLSRGATSDTARGFNYVVFDENAVEIEERIQFQKGEGINGYVDADGNIVINSDTAGLDTPIHEFAHIWERTIEKTNPLLHAQGMELIAGPDGKPYVDHVRQTQPGLEGRELYKEALAQAIGDRGARLIESQKQGPIKEWLKRAWEFIGNLVGISNMSSSEIAGLTLEQYADAAAVDLLQGKPIAKLPSGDIAVETTARTEADMDDADKFMADFISRMKLKNGVNFQGNVSGGLSTDDFKDLTRYFRYAIEKGQISTLSDARLMARSMGISSPADVDMAFKLAKTRGYGAVGFKKSEVSEETIANTDFAKMTDEEYREMGRSLVDQGLVNPNELVAEIIQTPRALQPWEVTALQYYRSNIESEMAEISSKLDSNDANYMYRVGGETLTGYKAMAQRMAFINEALFDLEVAMLTTANQQSAAFRLRSVMADKDFNIVQFLAEMKARGAIDPDLEQKLINLSNELNVVRAKLKEKSKEVDELQERIAVENINYTAQQPTRTRRVKPKKEVLATVEMTLDTIDPSAFGLPGMSFQANNTILFQTNPNPSLSDAVANAIATMRSNISEGKMNIADAIEQAVSDVDAAIGKGNWDSMKFKSEIANKLVGQGVAVQMKAPYVNTNGRLIVPGAYITNIAREGADTLDKMVQRVNDDLGGRFSEYDIRNAISGYGRQTAKTRTDLDRAISKAKRIAKLLSEIEDLETKGQRLKTRKQVDNNDAEIEALKQQVKRLEYDLEMTPEERDQLAEQKYNENRRKYLRSYIDSVQERIDNKDFAPKSRKNKYEEDSETRQLRAEAERIKNEFKKEKYRHELETRPLNEKIREYAYDLIFNITRALSAGFDASAIGVQAFIFSASRPVKAFNVLKDSMKGSFSEAEYESYFANLQADPLYEVARKAKLNLQLPSFYQSVQEEQFKGSIPAYLLDYVTGAAGEMVAKMRGGDVVKARQFAQDKFNLAKIADRNYSLVLSKVRMDLFREFVTNQVNKRGLDVELDAEEVARIAEVVNTITMASKVPGVEGKVANDITSMIMFSARKFVATWKILGAWIPLAINNRQLLKDAYGGVIGRGLGTLFTIAALPNIMGTLMAAYGDEDDEEDNYWYNKHWLNPKHSDFLKIRLGNTRISLFNGIDGNIVFATRFLSGEYMTSSSEAVKELGGASNNKTRGGLSWEYISNKFAPTTSILTNRFLYSDREKQESYERFKESFAPMWVTSMYEQYVRTGNVGETMALGAAGFFGLAYNNYGGAEFAIGPGTDNIKARGIFDRSGLSAYDPGNGVRKYFDGERETAVKGKNYKDVYLPAYQEFMREAVLSHEKNLSPDKHWEYKEGLVNNFKKEAYKHAELELSGVVFTSAFKDISYDGQKYVIPKSLYKLKADYIKQYMDEYSRDLALYKEDIKHEFLEREGVKPTDRYLEMLAKNELYKEAHREANQRMIDDMEIGKIKLIPKDEYVSSEDNFEDE